MSREDPKPLPPCDSRTPDGYCLSIGAFEIGDMGCECCSCPHNRDGVCTRGREAHDAQ